MKAEVDDEGVGRLTLSFKEGPSAVFDFPKFCKNVFIVVLFIRFVSQSTMSQASSPRKEESPVGDQSYNSPGAPRTINGKPWDQMISKSSWEHSPSMTWMPLSVVIRAVLITFANEALPAEVSRRFCGIHLKSWRRRRRSGMDIIDASTIGEHSQRSSQSGLDEWHLKQHIAPQTWQIQATSPIVHSQRSAT